VCVCVFVCACAYVCACVCAFVCLCGGGIFFVYTHTHIHTRVKRAKAGLTPIVFGFRVSKFSLALSLAPRSGGRGRASR